MANMSYCRFRNTYGDLRDCASELEDTGYDVSQCHEEEQDAAHDLLKLCFKILNNAPAHVLEQLGIDFAGEED